MGSLDVTVFSLIAILVLVFYFVKKRYSYWKNMGVPYEEPIFPYGNIKGIGKEFHSHHIMKRIYNKCKPTGAPFCGMYFYLQPIILAISVDFVKTVLVKDSAVFCDRGNYYNEDDDPLSAHLFNIDQPKWKPLRTKLTPTFTSGKMKMTYQTVLEVADRFIKRLSIEASEAVNNEIEMRDILQRFTTDVIGSTAFGLECNSLEDPNNEFRVKSKKVLDAPKFPPWVQMVLLAFKGIARKLHIKHLHDDSSNFFFKIVNETIQYREQNDISRNDFMHLLIQLKNKGALDGESTKIGTITSEEIAAQAFIFFLAGFETSSTAMIYSLFELAHNQKLQEKARENVKKILSKHNGQFTYEALCDMDYIENCVNESMRKYPPLSNLTRVCTKDYHVEGTNFVIKKGQMVFIPANAIQNDPEIYPNPEIYDPDRFTPEEDAKRSPYAFLPFGQGPRNCIGLRFGMMQSKLGVALLLNHFKFEPCSRSMNPIVYDNSTFVLTPKNGLYLKVTKL